MQTLDLFKVKDDRHITKLCSGIVESGRAEQL